MSFNKSQSEGVGSSDGARLQYIRGTKEKNLLLLGISDEGETARYTVSEAVYRSIGSPLRGELVTPSALTDIKDYDEGYRARKYALSLLSLADNNERGLTLKLVRHGFPRDRAAGVAREMVSLGYINEERQLERLILAEANGKLSGPSKIIPKLLAKGYRSSLVRAVISSLSDRGEIDFKENAKALLVRLGFTDAPREEKKKILYKHGYRIC
jgi:SOS response regulatory protein OraA/RecX